jgi:hypothetical protein
MHIDDDEGDLNKFSRQFKKCEKSDFKIDYISVNTDKILKDEKIFKKTSPDVILIDFQFVKKKPKEPVLPYNGLALSTYLRQIFPEIPMFLFSNPELVETAELSRMNRIFDVTDDTIFKKDYTLKNDINRGIVFSTVGGYNKLKSCKTKNFINLYKILNGPASSMEDVFSIIPREALNQKGQWSVFPIAKWIRKVLMEYPGILYDEIHAATFLGISLNEFREEKIQEFFKTAQYTGPFSDQENLWWKSELMTLSDKTMTEEEIFLEFNKGFIQMWKREMRESLKAAKCCFSGKSPADCVCCILKEPVMVQYSLDYKKDDRPSVMDRSRVSFKAIQTTDKVKKDLINPSVFEVYDKVISGKYAIE